MILHGTIQNKKAILDHALPMLGNMNIDITLDNLNIYLGQEYNPMPQHQFMYYYHPNTLAFPNIDLMRSVAGERGVQSQLTQFFLHELGHYLQDKYFPLHHRLWREIEDELGLTLDYRLHWDINIHKYNTPAIEFAANLFRAAMRLDNGLTMMRVTKERHQGRLIAENVEIINVPINPHFWRAWWYKLWGQSYMNVELWIGKKEYAVNGVKKSFDVAPTIMSGRTMLELRDLLVSLMGVKNEDIKWDGDEQKVTFSK